MFLLEADCCRALARLFEADTDGRLRFGWCGVSLQPATHADLLAELVRFPIPLN